MEKYSKNSIKVENKMNYNDGIANVKYIRGCVLRNGGSETCYLINLNGINYYVIQNIRPRYDAKRSSISKIDVYPYSDDKKNICEDKVNDCINMDLIDKILVDFECHSTFAKTYYFFNSGDGYLRLYNNIDEFMRDNNLYNEFGNIFDDDIDALEESISMLKKSQEESNTAKCYIIR